MEIPDLSSQTYLLHPADGSMYLSVGWLGTRVVNPSETAYDLLYLLREIESFNQLRDPCLGLHTCEICGLFAIKGEFFVQRDMTRYVLPNMVRHYITEHRYRLPAVVEEAIRARVAQASR
jgi:hypothetical protein